MVLPFTTTLPMPLMDAVAAPFVAQLKTEDPNVRRLLGVEGDLGKALGLDNKWGYFIVKAVGNFGEVWDRDITPMGVPRGLNNLWTKGGLQYPPPIR